MNEPTQQAEPKTKQPTVPHREVDARCVMGCGQRVGTVGGMCSVCEWEQHELHNSCGPPSGEKWY